MTSVGNDGPLTNYECGPVATQVELLYSPTNVGAASTTTQRSATTSVPSDHSSGSSATSGGAIAGYTVAGVIIAGLAALAAWFFGCVQAILIWRKREDHQPTY